MFDSLIVFFVLSVNFDEDCYFYENQWFIEKSKTKI